jgi:hypothetical protein
MSIRRVRDLVMRDCALATCVSSYTTTPYRAGWRSCVWQLYEARPYQPSEDRGALTTVYGLNSEADDRTSPNRGGYLNAEVCVS